MTYNERLALKEQCAYLLDAMENISKNGDVCTLHFDEQLVRFRHLNGNRGDLWQRNEAPANFALAYAPTVHKS